MSFFLSADCALFQVCFIDQRVKKICVLLVRLVVSSRHTANPPKPLRTHTSGAQSEGMAGGARPEGTPGRNEPWTHQ